MKKERKMKKNGFTTQNPRRFPGFTVVIVTFFVKILDDFHDFVSECVSLPTKINEKKIAKVSPSNNNYSFRII